MAITINEEKLNKIGDNVCTIVAGNKLIVVVDLGETIGLSSSGKMMGIASTEGFTSIATDMARKIKMNLYVGEKVV